MKTQAEVRDLLLSRDFDACSEALTRVGNCSRPIRLYGRSQTIDVATGEIVAPYSSASEPLGVTHVRCGNRRASECPSCSRLDAGDTFHLIRAGVASGKTVPASVAENPLVFATLTAALAWLARERAAMAGGIDPRAGRTTVRRLLPMWLEEHKDTVSKETYVADRAVPRLMPTALAAHPVLGTRVPKVGTPPVAMHPSARSSWSSCGRRPRAGTSGWRTSCWSLAGPAFVGLSFVRAAYATSSRFRCRCSWSSAQLPRASRSR